MLWNYWLCSIPAICISALLVLVFLNTEERECSLQCSDPCTHRVVKNPACNEQCPVICTQCFIQHVNARIDEQSPLVCVNTQHKHPLNYLVLLFWAPRAACKTSWIYQDSSALIARLTNAHGREQLWISVRNMLNNLAYLLTEGKDVWRRIARLSLVMAKLVWNFAVHQTLPTQKDMNDLIDQTFPVSGAGLSVFYSFRSLSRSHLPRGSLFGFGLSMSSIALAVGS